MTLNFKLYIVLFALFVSCKNTNFKSTDNNQEKFEKKVKQLELNYILTKNAKFLDSAYSILKEENIINRNTLDNNNLNLYYTIYFKSLVSDKDF